MDENTTILIKAPKDVNSGIVRASRGAGEPVQSKLNFKQAFANVKGSIKAVMAEFDDLHVEEAEIKFGLKSIGEAGIFAIGKVGGEMNYEVTLKWKKEKGAEK
ncbi:MAG: hypothetical protein HN855_07165 [Anaerolineae bacterium]|jgi:hypothetical protein|nr:hypothetical protein [Chloroflexota bacterium]MBT7324919.1 hypothetical protein [Anaerolineae bacterium]